MAGQRFTKADKEAFLRTCDSCSEFMPKEIIKKEFDLFGECIEPADANQKLQSIRLVLLYPKIHPNVDGNPIAKQSVRFASMKIKDGPNKGDVFTYTNKVSGKLDVIINTYQDARITNTTKMLQEQILKQLKEQHYLKYKGAIFITRMEFIFKHPASMSKKDLEELKHGKRIIFKETKPDLDNLEKIVWDSMQIEKSKQSLDNLEKDMRSHLQGLVYDNDAQIVSKNVIFKRWGLRPGVIIEMEGYV